MLKNTLIWAGLNSWIFFAAIPTLCFLLPQTASSITKVCLLIMLFSIMKFFTAEAMVAAVLLTVYVGAIAIMFLLAIVSLEQLKWKLVVRNWVPNPAVTLFTAVSTYAMFNCFVEVFWVATATQAPNYYGELTASGFRINPNNYTNVDPLLAQAIGFADNPTTYLLCGTLLLVGMYVVIQTLVTPETVTKYVEKSNKNNKKWF